MRRRRTWLITALSLVLLLLTSPAEAYRPFDGTDADVADYGEFELELGPLGFTRVGGSAGKPFTADGVTVSSGYTLNFFDTVLNYGIAPGFELVVQGSGQVGLPVNSAAQVVDTAVLVKSILRSGVLQGKAGPSIATELGLLVPEINADCCSGLSGALILSYLLGPVTGHLNLQAQLNRVKQADLFASLILEGPKPWLVRPVAEIYVETPAPGLLTESGLLGFIWTIRDNIAVDAAVRLANESARAIVEFRSGLSIGWQLLPAK